MSKLTVKKLCEIISPLTSTLILTDMYENIMQVDIKDLTEEELSLEIYHYYKDEITNLVIVEVAVWKNVVNIYAYGVNLEIYVTII